MELKEKAVAVIEERIEQVTQATNVKELDDYAYFAHGAANAMWELGVFTQPEHMANYDRIVATAKKRLEELKCR